MMALQEHSLYEEPNGYDKVHARMSGNEGNMFLDLDVKEEKKEALLTTPDVSVFALSTPEVHNMLAATTTNSIIKTPTPTRSLAPATMEQEIYAQGFLDRLEALESRNMMNKNEDPMYSMPSSVHHQISHFATGSNPSLEAVAPTYVTATLDAIPNFATQTVSQSTASYPVNTSSDGYYPDSSYVMPFRHDAVMPGGYSVLAAPGATIQPVGYNMMDAQLNPDVLREVTSVPDLRTQEHMKVERKKARNRIAASKCRLRRLQRESDLQVKVRNLREHNRELNDEVNGLKDQISNLKKALVQHMKMGCQVDDPVNFNSKIDLQSSPSE